MARILLEDRGDGITVATLNRAPVNAMNASFLTEIGETIQTLDDDASVRAVVMASPFKVFGGGLDIAEMVDFGPGDETKLIDELNLSFLRLYGFSKPLICAVNGVAVAGGLFPPLCADHTVAVGTARFGLSEVRVGANFPVAPMEIARAELTPAGLRRLMLRGRLVPAETAQHLGIVDEITGDDLLGNAVAAARDFAASPPKAFAAIKAQVRQPALDMIRDAVDHRSDPTRAGWFTDETKHAMQAALG